MTSGPARILGGTLLGVVLGVLATSLDDRARILLLLAPFLVAAAIDVRTRRIPNALSAGVLALAVTTALMQRTAPEALGGAAVALLVGAALAVAARGAFGAGDVKLMVGAGAVAGASHVLVFLLAMALAGGAMAAVMLAFRHGARSTMPYAPAIALGVADVLLVVAG